MRIGTAFDVDAAAKKFEAMHPGSDSIRGRISGKQGPQADSNPGAPIVLIQHKEFPYAFDAGGRLAE